MNLNEAKKRIQTYLQSNKSWPLIVDIQTREDIADIIDFFKIGGNGFPNVESFCNNDEILKLEELFALVSENDQDIFITEITGFLKILGEGITKKTLRTLATTSIHGHVVIITYQCKNYLKFSDPRINESGRVIIIDGSPDLAADIYFINPSLSNAFPVAYSGVQKIGYIMEHCESGNAYISTNNKKLSFTESIYQITQLDSGYDILRDKDPRTELIPKSFGTADQWNLVIQKMGNKGDWSSVIEEQFGSELNLSNSISSYSLFNEEKRWLYFIALSICGVKENEYLQMAVNNASNSEDLIKSIFRSILSIDYSYDDFPNYYAQRKMLLRVLKNALPETIDFCKIVSVKGENAIYYLTDSSLPEKEKIIKWLATYGEKYNTSELIDILKTVYPDLAQYLTKYRFKNELLDTYFDLYKYQKVINHILPSFESIVDEQSVKMDFVLELKPRTVIVEKLDVKNSRAFFFDALGIEYLGFIQEKCNEYGLSTNISCARCELPSLTSFNKEFVATLNGKGCAFSDIKDLDEIKHHGEDSFDYEKEKTPIYLIRELEIIDELLNKIRAGILSGQYDKAIILSDHGASRLAVLHETENIWSMATPGAHSGRCCLISEIDSKPDFAIEENGFWVLANYDRFKGSRKANVEVHGGASLEEVAVPIIEITQKRTNIEAFIVDGSRTILLGAKEHACIKIYVGIKSNNISIKLDGSFYDADATEDVYIYQVDLPEHTKKGSYEFSIHNGSDILASGQRFEIKKKGMSEVDLFG